MHDQLLESGILSLVRILVVDDEPQICHLIARVLETEGYLIAKAPDGLTAQKMLSEDVFDLIITDIVMPGINGIQLIKQIRQSFPGDVIAMTGQSDGFTYEKLIGFGASDFVRKPFTPDEMLLRVKRVLKERSMKDDLMRFQKELALSQKMESIGQLSAGIAHEINTPLQFISDNTTFVQQSLKDLEPVFTKLKQAGSTGSETPEFLDLCTEIRTLMNSGDVEYALEELPQAVLQSLEGIKSIRKTLQAMKELSHPGRKEHTHTDLNQCIKNVVIISRNEWKYDSELVLDLDETLPSILCNSSEINQVLLNLIVNASHAVTDQVKSGKITKGTIRITTRKKESHIEIAISDTGGGIPENIRPLIFNPFFTTKEIGRGTGQGLSIAKSIIADRHQGEIDLITAAEKGTTFFIRLPLGSDQAAPKNINPKPEAL